MAPEVTSSHEHQEQKIRIRIPLGPTTIKVNTRCNAAVSGPMVRGPPHEA
jgi:hypothetical protein